MRDYLLTKDCFHLSPQGYADFVSYQMQKFYQKFFMDDAYFLTNNNTETGSVSSTGNLSDTLFVGGSSGEQFSTILSFNTTTMLDTTLAKASIFLRRQDLSGANPISNNLEVKVKNGNFGTTASIEAVDLTSTADAQGTPCLFGSNDGNGSWIRLDLPGSILQHITPNAPTQFIISAPGFTTGKLYFNNATDPDFAPVLNLVYGQFSGVNELATEIFSIYPNPTNSTLTIKTDGTPIKHLAVVDVLGKKVSQPNLKADGTIDVSMLPSGMYILNLTTDKGSASQRFVKN